MLCRYNGKKWHNLRARAISEKRLFTDEQRRTNNDDGRRQTVTPDNVTTTNNVTSTDNVTVNLPIM